MLKIFQLMSFRASAITLRQSELSAPRAADAMSALISPCCQHCLAASLLRYY